MKKIDFYRETILQKDIYILESYGEHFLINNGYHGLEVLNKQLETIKKIDLFEDIIIYSIFKKFDETFLFLDCSDNRELVLIDMGSESFKFLRTSAAVTFIPGLYSWKNQLILATDNDRYYCLDHNTDFIKEASILNVGQENHLFIKFCSFAKKIHVIRYFPEKYQFIFQDYAERKLGFYSLLDDEIITIDCEADNNSSQDESFSPYFDVQFIEGLFILISENSIDMRDDQNLLTITCDNTFSFMRVIPFIVFGKIHLTVLGFNKSNPSESFLRQYKIS